MSASPPIAGIARPSRNAASANPRRWRGKTTRVLLARLIYPTLESPVTSRVPAWTRADKPGCRIGEIYVDRLAYDFATILTERFLRGAVVVLRQIAVVAHKLPVLRTAYQSFEADGAYSRRRLGAYSRRRLGDCSRWRLQTAAGCWRIVAHITDNKKEGEDAKNSGDDFFSGGHLIPEPSAPSAARHYRSKRTHLHASIRSRAD